MSASGILRRAEGGRVLFWCPGCDGAHAVNVGPGGWSFNGDFERPTFLPSVLVRYDGSDAGKDGAPPAVCHSFVTDGEIRYLNDCTHALAGQTVPLKDFDAD
ncbi:hypothetical protein Mpop_2665 [Methylorubrum populi BJ001]|jgi:hypothetical protein|uniref:Ammonia monooxygenase n=1 Tax=Methylorubrum populi (strain ATCC BAA-705 / NCIMB 13946 / BJ001) TaxID=441620 RepID=B1ZCC9_METPB|nr:DUF6527 family protein [Methylorubrum populi]ACB80822.1 hypothetical protein Mpop_2665 [Methylorubrum populi BJ001]